MLLLLPPLLLLTLLPLLLLVLLLPWSAPAWSHQLLAAPLPQQPQPAVRQPHHLPLRPLLWAEQAPAASAPAACSLLLCLPCCCPPWPGTWLLWPHRRQTCA
jgi:hypothetical protein